MFDRLFYPLYLYAPDLYEYDIRGLCYDEKVCENTNLTNIFLNLDMVKESFNVSIDIEWTLLGNDTQNKLFWQLGTDFSPFVRKILHNDINCQVLQVEELLDEGLKIVVDVGVYDLVVNGIATKGWMEDMDWKYQKEWNAIQMKNYTINDSVVGKIKSSYNLTLAFIDNAAHSVIENKPDIALSLILDLTYGE